MFDLYLKRIEVKGFKSFADKIDLDFNGGITAIVGPNGSGKSNISDAIRWVLGEQSAKTLRGAKMEDVIFAGTENRKPLGCAEVSLTIDNSDNIIPMEYSEITVTRRLYRSGESEYLINNTICRLKDIHEIFMDTGIGKDGYSLIGQGRVDEILSTRSEDRRNLFEEAAGIVKYKTRKLEAERKLENTRQNILRIDDIISELESQIDPLKDQSEVAKKYLAFKEELKELEVNLLLHNYNESKLKYNKLSNDIEAIQQSKNQEENKKISIRQEINDIKQKLVEIEVKIEEVSTKRLELEKSQENKQGEVKVLNERYNNYVNEIERINLEINNLNDYIKEIDESINNSLLDEEHVLEEIKLIQDEINKLEKDYDVLNKKYAQIEDEIENKKSNLLELLGEISQEKNKISSLEITIENLDRRKQQLILNRENKNQQLTNEENERDILNKDLNRYNDEKEHKEELLNLYVEQIKISQDEEKRLQNEKNKLISEIKSCEARYTTLKSLEKEMEGFNKASKYVLTNYKENFGVLGAISDIIKVPNGYELALEIALGSAIQNIVVKNEEVAIKLIEILKNNKVGRVTFYPLTTMKYKPIVIDNNVKAMKGYLGLANEIVLYDTSFNNIIGNLLGRVVICDNMDNAKQIAKALDYSVRIVTLDGDVINSGGSFTGGSNNKAHGIFSRKNEIESLGIKIEQLHSNINNVENQIKSLNNNVSEYNYKKLDAENKLREIEKNIQVLNGKILFNQKQIEELMNNINEIDIELEQIQLENDKMISQITSKKEGLTILEEKQIVVQNELDEIQLGIKDIQVNKDVMFKQLADKRIVYAEKNKILEGINQRQKQLEKEKQNYEIRIKNYKVEIETLNLKIEETKANIKSALVELQKYAEDIINVKEEFYTLDQNKKDLADLILSKEKQLASIDENITSIVDSIHKIDIAKNKAENEMETVSNKLWEEYELTIPQASKYKIEINNISNISKKVYELKNNIRLLGDVNVNSIEEYKRVIERYNFLKEQREDLVNAEKSLVEIINEMVQKMTEQFKTNFRIIRENFNITFKELFGGGYADLKIDGEDVLNSGIEIIVQPPGKKLQSLSLLSGGERGLAAIALIFAILRMKPTPFCVLDEIEAALDDANVNRFAEFLKDYSKKTQFIIITHRKGSMAAADTLYGVTMEEKGVSKVVSLKLRGGNE